MNPRHDAFEGEDLAIATRSLTLRFGQEAALDDLHLSVPEGSVYLLAGRNGAGTSTIFRVLMDLLRPHRGEVEVFGESVAELGPSIRSQFGWVAEARDLPYPWMKVGRLLDYHSRYFPTWDDGYARELCTALQISRAKVFGALSIGQARRVQWVLALAHRPQLLLLDEPLNGLDPVACDVALSLFAEHLAQSPTTVLVASHQVARLERMVDCIGILSRGHLSAQLRRSHLAEQLHRVRGIAPASWQKPDLGNRLVSDQASDKEFRWTLWGEAEQIRSELEGSGAQVFELRSLALEEAVHELLSQGDD